MTCGREGADHGNTGLLAAVLGIQRQLSNGDLATLARRRAGVEFIIHPPGFILVGGVGVIQRQRPQEGAGAAVGLHHRGGRSDPHGSTPGEASGPDTVLGQTGGFYLELAEGGRQHHPIGDLSHRSAAVPRRRLAQRDADLVRFGSRLRELPGLDILAGADLDAPACGMELDAAADHGLGAVVDLSPHHRPAEPEVTRLVPEEREDVADRVVLDLQWVRAKETPQQGVLIDPQVHDSGQGHELHVGRCRDGNSLPRRLCFRCLALVDPGSVLDLGKRLVVVGSHADGEREGGQLLVVLDEVVGFGGEDLGVGPGVEDTTESQ